jgi:histidinol-phosphate aminotransferase
VYPSDANFLLVRMDDAKSIYNRLIDKGIIVRDRSGVILCGESLRITVGTEQENTLLLEALQKI